MGVKLGRLQLTEHFVPGLGLGEKERDIDGTERKIDMARRERGWGVHGERRERTREVRKER